MSLLLRFSRQLFLSALLLVTPVLADLSDGLPEPGVQPDTTQVYRTSNNLVLQLPRLVWTWMIYPLGQATIYTEREELPQRAQKLFTNEAGTFGIYPQVQLGGETGTGGGARLFHTDVLGGDESLELIYLFSAASRQRAEFLFEDPTVGAGGLFWNAYGTWLDTDHEDATVNGVIEGREDLEDQLAAGGQETLFGEQRADVQFAFGWRSNAGPLEEFRAGFTAELRAGWAQRQLDELTPRPNLLGETSTVTASAVPGLNQDLTYNWAGLRLAWDDRDAAAPRRQLTHSLRYQFPGRVLLEHGGLYHSFRNIAYPEGGGLAEISFDIARGDDVEFSRLGAEVQRFHTLFWKERVLAVRARLDKVFQATDGLAPYGDLPTLGGSTRLRGYKRGTFRGEGALLLAAEYRWPVWDTWNASLFWEEGHVFDDFDDIQSDTFASSVGIGLTMRSERAYLLGLRLAHSARNDVLLGFSLEHEF